MRALSCFLLMTATVATTGAFQNDVEKLERDIHTLVSEDLEEDDEEIKNFMTATKQVVWDTPSEYWGDRMVETTEAAEDLVTAGADILWDTPVKYWESFGREQACTFCQDWYQKDYDIDAFAFLDMLPDCPCVAEELLDNMDSVYRGVSWVVDAGCVEDNCMFHPGAYNCYRSEGGDSPHAQQCCYNQDGVLMTTGFAAGTPDRGQTASYKFVHQVEERTMPDNIYDNMRKVGQHVTHDVISWDLCCKHCSDGCSSCAKYYGARHPNKGAEDDGSSCEVVDTSATRDCSKI